MESDVGFHIWVFEIYLKCLRQRHPTFNKAVGVSFLFLVWIVNTENEFGFFNWHYQKDVKKGMKYLCINQLSTLFSELDIYVSLKSTVFSYSFELCWVFCMFFIRRDFVILSFPLKEAQELCWNLGPNYTKRIPEDTAHRNMLKLDTENAIVWCILICDFQ